MIALTGPAWMVVAACCAAAAVWWLPAPPVRLQDVRAGAPRDDDWEPSGTLVIALVIAALEQGASIPAALRTVGTCCGPACANALAAVAGALERGVPWDDAWSVASALVDEPGTRGLAAVLHTLDDALRSPWLDGSAAVPRLRAAAEQLDSLERMRIERAASTLSVRLLLPMGLCFLPAFLCIAVVPTIMSFVQG
ncbi:type II secretion system protein [Bifidobacterium pseudolongum subsp. globosum]|uniref:Type II secretion system protein n=1 Tax=Bifidobacterium pseudolongum subsp. globosum TaxID=1690 RepID=A0A4V1Y1Y7_9BIFI|nr:type II secretion system F family protein [Bifidobacterium pseudolongum]RYQ12098.1 type II secretion system protein [Bifidobacterium pseudolongum subsp. globosum]